ncbi:MAG: sulfatase-like hydrolase/transferase [Prolixibacteraceae bacterium]
MKKYSKITGGIIALSSMIACSFNSVQKSEIRKPNIIVLLVDDAGYADFGFMGSKDLKTPNIDKLAAGGVVFTDAHVSATVCGPSRAGIMTGRYQQRFGFECNPSSDSCGVNLNEYTIASAMKQAGYTTAAFGKWHLGDKPGYRPTERGFDYYWGFLSGSRSYFYDIQNSDKPGDSHAIIENLDQVSFDGYLTDRLGDKAVDFIEKNKDNPFFIYWAPNAVHTPMEAKAEDLDIFEGHPRQKLAAMTWALDRAVGHIVDKLEKEGLLENTLIFFLSDNGGAANNQSTNFPLKGFKGNKFEGGHRVPFIVSWASGFKGGKTFEGLTSSLDIYATAADAAKSNLQEDTTLDGVSLLPYLKGEKQGNPHQNLFWRKDKMAAARVGNFKLIRVDKLPSVMYNLADDLGETNNLAAKNPQDFQLLNSELKNWEKETVAPLWTEGAWDTITWMIHQDLMLNRPVRVKDPGQLKKYRQNQK